MPEEICIKLTKKHGGRLSCKRIKISKKSDTRFDPTVFLKTAAKGRIISTLKEGVVIFRQGDDADSVLYIQTGKVKVTVISQEGKEAVVAILGQHQFFGEGCLIGQPNRLATAVATTECSMLSVTVQM